MDHEVSVKDQDDGAALVQEVVDENPPEEQGVREEWRGQVGWHRKENIRVRDGSSVSLRGSKNSPVANDNLVDSHGNEVAVNALGMVATKKWWEESLNLLYIICGVLLVLGIIMRLFHSRWRTKGSMIGVGKNK